MGLGCAFSTSSRSSCLVAVVACAFALPMLACSEEERAPRGEWQGGSVSAFEPCAEGSERQCSVTLGEDDGIRSCFHGLQVCENGRFGACQEGWVEHEVGALEGGNGTGKRYALSLSTPTFCSDPSRSDYNPCDPRCQVFVESPPSPITPMGVPSELFANGPVPDWSTPASVASCGHSLCSEGEALEAGCHACADRVCAVEPPCCADTGGVDWDASCVGLVYSECLGQAPQEPTPEYSPCDFAALGQTRLRAVHAGSVIGGRLGANSPGGPALEVGGQVTVSNIQTVGDVTIAMGTTVLGDVSASGSVTNDGVVVGLVSEGTDYEGVPLPTRAVDCVAGDSTTSELGSTTLADGDTRVVRPINAGTPVFTFAGPGSFGGFSGGGRDTRLVFPSPGTYTFSKWEISSGSSVVLQVPDGGPVVIEICGASDVVSHSSPQVDLLGSMQLVSSGGTAVMPHQVQLYTNFAGDIPFAVAALAGITLIAPFGRVYSTGPAGVARGMILADEVDLVTELTLDASGFTGPACLEAGILGAGVGACPIDLAIPEMPQILREPCLSGDDCQANTRCIEVATAPECSHSKCTLGEALSGACVAADSCVERICEVDASCCEQDSGWTCLPGNKCSAAECGDGLVRGLEECDDGSDASGDGCSSTCDREPGYVCVGEPSVCTPTVCGDGVREGDETCDDGGLAPWDGCSRTCGREPWCPPGGGACSSVCGDGMTLPGDAEECDDGNLQDGDGCSSACSAEVGFVCQTGLASDANNIELPVIFRDFANRGPNKHPDFESFTGQGRTPGMVDDFLGADGLPVYTGICEAGSGFGAAQCPTMGDFGGTSSGAMTSSPANFEQWYRWSTQSRSYWDSVELTYDAATDKFVFDAFGTFYPLSGRPWVATGDGAQWSVGTGQTENFGFTTEMRHWFEYQGGEELYFHGDDDVWVFINGRLMMDLGGTHPDVEAKVTLSGAHACEEYTDWGGTTHPPVCRDIGISPGNVYEIALFHADRHTDNSNFFLTLSGFFVEPTVCSSVCGDGFVTADEVCDDGVNDGGSGECEPGCRSWDASGISTGQWSASCVDMVKTECDAWCGAVSDDEEPPGVVETGACVDAGESFIDETCGGVDLTAGFGCGGQVPVCNQGTMDAPAGVELTFFPRQGAQLSTETPDLSWSSGSCVVTEPIPAGTCRPILCDPALMSVESTLMVNQGEEIPECSLLDNWTVIDPSEKCPFGAPVTFSEVYEAVCPDDSLPSWGFLTWDTDTPGDSRVEFSARVAATSADLDSEDLVLVGTAHGSPVDTSRCAYVSSLSECPVQFLNHLPSSPDGAAATVVNPTTGQRESVSFLELEVSLLPDGSDLPSISDWNVTFSCIYDQ